LPCAQSTETLIVGVRLDTKRAIGRGSIVRFFDKHVAFMLDIKGSRP
jgi:hypothetical protein